MKKFWIVLVLMGMGTAYTQDYFQQEVNYTISVKLNDKGHTLSGFEEFEYINHSPTALDKIYIHLWPNAYSGKKTALGRQLFDQNNTTLEFAPVQDKGFIDSLAFKVNGTDVRWEYYEENRDIAVIYLNEVLQVGTPFFVQIPSGHISRFGHIGESYQVTQWYPKPAVYDKDGWHPIPYLNQGEFYSEFGSYDVSITLPKNYVVGATGDLQTQSEMDFIEEKVKQTNEKFEKGKFAANAMTNPGPTEFPDSDNEFKTIRYTQKNVHDFAWFADKRFQVLKGEVELPNSGHKVTSWAMFVPHHAMLWEKSIEYINDGVFYYSKWNGDYPYDNVTAVDGTISAGGGMEYPNVTVIGSTGSAKELEVVIVHEVGHNWFYGLLGSNEREHPWMDEGLNTLNEIRYMETKYPKNERLSDMFRGVADKVHLEDLSHRDLNDITYSMVAGYGIDQPIELPAADYSQVNYGAIVYSKTGLVFTYLRDYLGDKEFDRIMHVYFDEWHYKHPQPEDFRKIVERESGKDLSWLFDQILPTTRQIDYKLCKVKKDGSTTKVTVKNVGQVDGPIRVDALSLGQLRETKWTKPGEKKTVLEFPGTTYDQVVIDNDLRIPEVNRNNNSWKSKGLFKKLEPVKFEFLAGDNERNKTQVWFTPIMGGNVYDKFMVGFMFHNQTIPKNKFQYTLAPMFSVGRLNVAGFADINYSWVPAQNFRSVTVGILGKTFGNGLGYAPDSTTSPLGTYYVVTPYLRMEIGKPRAKKYYHQELELRGNYVFEGATLFDNSTVGGSGIYDFSWSKRGTSFGTQLRLDYYNVTLSPGKSFQHNSDLMNASVELKFGLTYWKKKKKGLQLRIFAGQNLFANNLVTTGPQSTRYGFNLAGQSGTQDAFYEHYMMGRNRNTGLWANQRIENQGGFKSTSSAGYSNKTVVAANFIFELPYIPFVVLYADYGVFDNGGKFDSMYDAGAGLRFGRTFGIYFPFYESANMIAPGAKYGQRIRFTLTMEGLNPAKIVQKAL